MQITPLHEIRDEKKLEHLIESMQSNGWQGRSLIVIDRGGNEQQAITGSHRLVAAEIAGIDPEYEEIEEPIDCDDDVAELFSILMNSDDDERLNALEELCELGYVSSEIVEIMKQET